MQLWRLFTSGPSQALVLSAHATSLAHLMQLYALSVLFCNVRPPPLGRKFQNKLIPSPLPLIARFTLESISQVYYKFVLHDGLEEAIRSVGDAHGDHDLISRRLLITSASFSDEASVMMMERKDLAPHEGWETALQQPKSRI